jgi:quercetin dioxygenase-like cupin family protein
MAQATLHRWDDLSIDKPMEMLERKRIVGEQAMISRVSLQKGCTVPMHAHGNEQMACILSGKLRFQIEDRASGPRTVDAGPGSVLLLPANVPHAAEALEDTVALDVFSPPSQTTGVDVGKK